MFIWTIGDIIGAVCVGGVMLVILIISTVTTIRQLRCKHDGGVNETSACDAICRNCGKNLGFIGSLVNRGRTQ